MTPDGHLTYVYITRGTTTLTPTFWGFVLPLTDTLLYLGLVPYWTHRIDVLSTLKKNTCIILVAYSLQCRKGLTSLCILRNCALKNDDFWVRFWHLSLPKQNQIDTWKFIFKWKQNRTAMHSFGSARVTWNCTRRNDRRTGVRNLGLIVFFRCESTTVFSALCFAFTLRDKLQPLADQVWNLWQDLQQFGYTLCVCDCQMPVLSKENKRLDETLLHVYRFYSIHVRCFLFWFLL